MSNKKNTVIPKIDTRAREVNDSEHLIEEYKLLREEMRNVIRKVGFARLMGDAKNTPHRNGGLLFAYDRIDETGFS